MDKNGNGLIAKEEMIEGFTNFNDEAELELTEEDAGKLFDAMDIN